MVSDSTIAAINIYVIVSIGWHRRCKTLDYMYSLLGLAFVGNAAVKHANHCEIDNQGTAFFFFWRSPGWLSSTVILCGIEIPNFAQGE